MWVTKWLLALFVVRCCTNNLFSPSLATVHCASASVCVCIQYIFANTQSRAIKTPTKRIVVLAHTHTHVHIFFLIPSCLLYIHNLFGLAFHSGHGLVFFSFSCCFCFGLSERTFITPKKLIGSFDRQIFWSFRVSFFYSSRSRYQNTNRLGESNNRMEKKSNNKNEEKKECSRGFTVKFITIQSHYSVHCTVCTRRSK